MSATVRAAAVRARATRTTPAGTTTKSAPWCRRPRSRGLGWTCVAGSSLAVRSCSFTFACNRRAWRRLRSTSRLGLRPCRPAERSRSPCGSGDGTNVRRLGALLALRHIELDLLVLLQVAVPGARDGAEVHEH